MHYSVYSNYGFNYVIRLFARSFTEIHTVIHNLHKRGVILGGLVKENRYQVECPAVQWMKVRFNWHLLAGQIQPVLFRDMQSELLAFFRVVAATARLDLPRRERYELTQTEVVE